MNPNLSVHPSSLSSLMLFSLSLGGYALMYLVNIFLARQLSIDAFDDYSVAVSIVTLLSTLATLGLEKYALRVIALYMERENWQRLRGFWLFSLRVILSFSCLLLGILAFGLEYLLAWQQADFHIAIVIYAGFLPVIALCLFMIEVINVYGRQILALALYRFFVPCFFLLLIIFVVSAKLELSAVSAVICYGLAWCCALGLIVMTVQRISPRNARNCKADTTGKYWWLKRALPLLISSLMMTFLTSAGTIILEVLYPSQALVGTFAVVMQTTGLISLIGTSTNRYYLPMLVILLERHDRQGVRRLLAKRSRLISCFIAVFMGGVTLWGNEILALFGPNFSHGAEALLISSAGATFSTLFADSPYYLQFMGRNRLVIGLMTLAAGLMLILGFLLAQSFGMTGMAVAYALPTILLFSTMRWQANRHLDRLLLASAPA